MKIVLEMLKYTLKFTLKCSYMFRFNKPSSGGLLLCFAKVIIIKIHITLVKKGNELPDDGLLNRNM